jgi:hypothetical protein
METDFADIDESFAEKRGKSQPSETSSNYGAGPPDNIAQNIAKIKSSL